MRRFIPYAAIAFFSALLFFHSLGSTSLFDWDEINFAESAREMIVTGNYMRVQINYEPFWEKPPFFFWLQAASMQIFGIGELAARLPNALCGVITLMILYAMGARLHSSRMAWWWVFIYTASFLPHLYFKSGIIDPWFNLFIFLSIYFLSRFRAERVASQVRNKMIIFSGFFAGMGIITKGPVALLVILLTYLVFTFIKRKELRHSFKEYLLWGTAMGTVTLLWFGLEVAQHGWWFVEEFVTYQIRLARTEDAGHGGFLLYHFVVLFVGCFPASILMWGRANKEADNEKFQDYFSTMMKASLGVILVVFTLVQTKIVHYSSFAYLPIGYLAAVQVDRVISGKMQFVRWQSIALLVLGIFWGVAFTMFPLIGNHPEWIRPLLSKDPFAVANLQAEVSWNYLLVLPGMFFLMAVIISFVFFKKRKNMPALFTLLVACIVAMQVLLTSFAPRIEKYSQHAAVDFFKSLQNKNVYVGTVGYKSYASYFYARAGKNEGVIVKPGEWILLNKPDKPSYLVSKITEKERLLKEYSFLKVLYEKNGFVFYERKTQ
jgi:4-amino-4-deoxy-L-arabinose transferase-like glycosyltransferase